MRSHRASIAIAFVAIGATVTACSSDTTHADSYWDGYHTGYKTAADYAKRTGETELSYCQSEQAVASMCDHPWCATRRHEIE